MTTFSLIGSSLPSEFSALEGEGFVVDLTTMEQGALRALASEGQPIIILNATADRMSAEVGFGLDCAGVVWHPTPGNGPDLLTYVPSGPPNVVESDSIEGKFEEATGHEEGPTDATVLEEASAQLMPPVGEELAALLHATAISPPPLSGQGTPTIDPIPDGVAGKQFLVTQAVSCSYHPKSYTWEHRKKPIVVKNQTAEISLPFFVEIYASTQPENKFVRVTTWGTGFNPGKLASDSGWGRYFFQDRMSVGMTLDKAPGSLVLYTEPKNLNNEATYSSTKSLTVGYKQGEKSEGSVQASISATVSSTLSAFKISEHSTGQQGAWNFDMQLCGKKNDGVYDVNKPESLIDWKNKVWEVPSLASGTLFPACMAAWALPLSCQSRASMKIDTMQRLTYARANYWEWMTAGCTMKYPISASVDLSVVNVK